MYSRSGCVYCLRMCTAITHTIFLSKNKSRSKLQFYSHFRLCNDTFSLYSFCVLLIVIEDCCFCLFQLKIGKKNTTSHIIRYREIPSYTVR